MRKYVIIIIVLMLGECRASTFDRIWGVWNPGKKETTTNYMNANTPIGLFKGTYSSLYILPYQKGPDVIGTIHDLGTDLNIINIQIDNITWSMKVRFIQTGVDSSGKPIEKWLNGEIIVHFINLNEIWFENKLDSELSKIIEMYDMIRFGSANTYWRAEKLSKPIIPSAP